MPRIRSSRKSRSAGAKRPGPLRSAMLRPYRFWRVCVTWARETSPKGTRSPSPRRLLRPLRALGRGAAGGGGRGAGAVLVKGALLDGNAMLYAPAPQTVYDDSRPIERIFAATSPQPVPEASVEERLAKEVRFDPDAWIVETEDRVGRHFLDLART